MKSYAIKSAIFCILFLFFRYMGGNVGMLKYREGTSEALMFQVYGYSMLVCIVLFLYCLTRMAYLYIKK